MRVQLRLGIFLVALLGAHSAARADDFDTLRARFLENLTGGPSLTVDPLVQADREATVERATAMLDPGNAAGLAADGSFKGLRYDDANDPNVRPRGLHSHFLRVVVLARAYQMPGLPLYHASTLRAAIERAIRFGIAASRYCGDASCVTGNWWEWRIGVPGNASYTLLLMDGELPSALLSELASHAEFHMGPVSALDSPAVTGQNLMWLAQIHLRIAIFRRDTTRAPAIKAGVDKTCEIVREPQGDGIRPDRSFQQHHGVLYIAGYGASYAADIASYIRYTAGTAFALDAGRVQNVVDYVLDGVAFSQFRGVFDPSVRGRDVNRKTAGTAPVDPFVQLAVASTYRSPELTAVAKALIADGLVPSPALSSQTRQVEAASTALARPSGHRHFQDADFTVHRRDDYYLSIKMFSTRTRSGEYANGAGLVNARQSDGRMVLFRNGAEWNGAANEGLWPALDWTRMPGTTVEQTGHAASDVYGLSAEAFVGGTDDGQGGVSAMQLSALDSTLRAKKSWFFFEGVTVFLVSDITSDSAFPVETIVTQWPFAQPDTTLATDGGDLLTLPADARLSGVRWLRSDGLSYWFPAPSDVHVELKTQTGSWRALGTDSGTVSAPFLTVSVEHGARVAGAQTAYAIALRDQDVTRWHTEPPFTIIRHDAELDAVEAADAAGAVFWQPGSVALLAGSTVVESDVPSVVWLAREGTTLTVSAADPAQADGTFTLTVTGDFVDAQPMDPGVRVERTPAGAILTLDRTGGVSHRARLTLPAPPAPPDAGADAGVTPGDGGQPLTDAGTDAAAPADGGHPRADGGKVRGAGCALRARGGARHGDARAFVVLALALLCRRGRTMTRSRKWYGPDL